MNELAEAADENKPGRTLARYGRVDLLCLDEFGTGTDSFRLAQPQEERRCKS